METAAVPGVTMAPRLSSLANSTPPPPSHPKTRTTNRREKGVSTQAAASHKGASKVRRRWYAKDSFSTTRRVSKGDKSMHGLPETFSQIGLLFNAQRSITRLMASFS